MADLPKSRELHWPTYSSLLDFTCRLTRVSWTLLAESAESESHELHRRQVSRSVANSAPQRAGLAPVMNMSRLVGKHVSPLRWTCLAPQVNRSRLSWCNLYSKLTLVTCRTEFECTFKLASLPTSVHMNWGRSGQLFIILRSKTSFFTWKSKFDKKKSMRIDLIAFHTQG